jgi:hypothetical protein
MAEWISVSKELPKVGRVVILGSRRGVFCGYMREKQPKQRHGVWRIHGMWYEFEFITYWMPLPEPPAE